MIPDQTSWTLIGRAAAGVDSATADFTAHFEPIVRRQLNRRWRGTPLHGFLDDATQEVLLACFREGGVLARAAVTTPPSFRGYLFGVVRNTARRFEARCAHERSTHDSGAALDELPASATTLGRFHDRAAAREVLRRATARHRAWAASEDAAAARRFELLRLRFEEGLAIRDVADRWGEAADTLHKEYRRARREFRRSLEAEFATVSPGDPEQLWQDLVEALRT